MLYAFLDFELSPHCRELRLRGRTLPLQPRVFDLLVYLVERRDRVVSKQELMDAVWPDVVVHEGSLKRTVSLARSALREGGAENLIRTFSRQGYRFDGEVQCRPHLETTAPATAETLGLVREARAAYDRASWPEAVAGFARADSGEGPLRGADLERWGSALYCMGEREEAAAPLERASAAYLMAGDRAGAARVALLLALNHFELREMAVATGWLGRAERLLEGSPAGREHGLFEMLQSRICLTEGRIEQAREHAERCLSLGKSSQDADLIALALLYVGHARVVAGELQAGQRLQDEAAATVLSDEVTPWVGALVHCGVVYIARNLGDWRRAAQWSDRFARFCQELDLSDHSGTCRLHRAEVLRMRGALEEAQRETEAAAAHLQRHAPWAAGDAQRALGDLALARGDLDAARDHYHRAHALGWDPHPGYAHWQLARGNARRALSGMERALADGTWPNNQRRPLLLSHLVGVALEAGDVERARTALDELSALLPSLHDSDVTARALQGRGRVLRAEGKLDDARRALQKSIQRWTEMGAVLDVAECRLHLAEVLIDANDAEGAQLELQAAQALLQKQGALPLLRRCASLALAVPS